MTIYYNKNSEKNNRRKLRNESTVAERQLWEILRRRKLLGLKFRRQYSIEQFDGRRTERKSQRKIADQFKI